MAAVIGIGPIEKIVGLSLRSESGFPRIVDPGFDSGEVEEGVLEMSPQLIVEHIPLDVVFLVPREPSQDLFQACFDTHRFRKEGDGKGYDLQVGKPLPQLIDEFDSAVEKRPDIGSMIDIDKAELEKRDIRRSTDSCFQDLPESAELG